MNIKEYQQLKKWFLKYTDSFLSDLNADRENILLKKEHTLRVCSNMALICADLCENDQIIGLATALLHDVGRFEQLKRYGTFSDSKSEDHAALGVRIIKEQNILNSLDPIERQLIITAVENHNKAVITDGLSERTLQICKRLRDAEKLDIWKVVLGYYEQGLEKDNPTVVHNLPAGKDLSFPVYEALKQQHIISYSMIETIVDIKVVQMGWIFDINTDKALSLTAERGYLEAIYKTLPQTERINHLYQIMKKYLLENAHPAVN
jgi:hypothetical protein